MVALEAAHTDLLQPPSSLLDQPEKLARWQTECHSKIKPVVDWDVFQRRHSGHEEEAADLDENQHEQPEEVEDGEAQALEGKEAETLTIGLIGESALS